MADYEIVAGLLREENEGLVLVQDDGVRWRLKGEPRAIELAGNRVEIAGIQVGPDLLEVVHIKEIDREP